MLMKYPLSIRQCRFANISNLGIHKPTFKHSFTTEANVNALVQKKAASHQSKKSDVVACPSIIQGFDVISRTTSIFRPAWAPQLVFLGAPGVGKGIYTSFKKETLQIDISGTFASRLATRWKIPHVSTGDIIRVEISRGTSEGLTFQNLSERGELIPDDLIISIVEYVKPSKLL